MQSATVVKDPVCGMDIDKASAAGHTEHDGQTYHFCNIGCKEKFDREPAQYLGKPASDPKSGHGCCSE